MILIINVFSEKAVAVPEQLHRYISRKHFLHAAELLVETSKLIYISALVIVSRMYDINISQRHLILWEKPGKNWSCLKLLVLVLLLRNLDRHLDRLELQILYQNFRSK